MDHDERISLLAEDVFQTIPVLYRWILRPDSTGMSPFSPRIAVLSVVKKQGPISMSGIASALSYSKQNLTKIVDQLFEEGYVERTPDTLDRRVLFISLTEAGRTFMIERKARMKDRLVEDLSELTDEELDRLFDTFERVKSALPRIISNERSGKV